MNSNKYNAHQVLLKRFKLELQNTIPNIRIFDRHVGMFFTKRGTPLKINTKGMADLWALVPSNLGLIHIEMEVKSGKSKQSPNQITWEKFIQSMGGLYVIVNDDYFIAINKILNYLEKSTLA